MSVVGVRLGEDNAGYSQTLVLLNHGREAVSVELQFPGPGQRLRVSPERLPRQPDIPSRQTAVHELPLRDWQSLAEGGDPIHLDPGELTVITSKTNGPETGLTKKDI